MIYITMKLQFVHCEAKCDDDQLQLCIGGGEFMSGEASEEGGQECGGGETLRGALSAKTSEEDGKAVAHGSARGGREGRGNREDMRQEGSEREDKRRSLTLEKKGKGF